MKLLFSGEINEIKPLLNLLKSLPSDEFAIFRPLDEGLKITIENSKSSEISIYVPRAFFASYDVVANADLIFRIQFRNFMDALQIFGDEYNPSIKMTYAKVGDPFKMTILHSEDNITVDAEFATLSVDDFQDAYLMEECNVNSVIFHGKGLVELLGDLDPISDDYELSISNGEPNVRFAANSIMGNTSLDICNGSPIIASFKCSEEFTAKYNFKNLLEIMKVMEMATKVSVSTGRSELLGFNLLIDAGDRQVYVEYYFTAQFDDTL